MWKRNDKMTILTTNGEYEYAVCVGIEKLETKLDVLESGKEKVM